MPMFPTVDEDGLPTKGMGGQPGGFTGGGGGGPGGGSFGFGGGGLGVAFAPGGMRGVFGVDGQQRRRLGMPAVPGVTPGAPQPSDTVPAMLTPGEIVMNNGVTSDPQLAQALTHLNMIGAQRMMQPQGFAFGGLAQSLAQRYGPQMGGGMPRMMGMPGLGMMRGGMGGYGQPAGQVPAGAGWGRPAGGQVPAGAGWGSAANATPTGYAQNPAAHPAGGGWASGGGMGGYGQPVGPMPAGGGWASGGVSKQPVGSTPPVAAAPMGMAYGGEVPGFAFGGSVGEWLKHNVTLKNYGKYVAANALIAGALLGSGVVGMPVAGAGAAGAGAAGAGAAGAGASGAGAGGGMGMDQIGSLASMMGGGGGQQQQPQQQAQPAGTLPAIPSTPFPQFQTPPGLQAATGDYMGMVPHGYAYGGHVNPFLMALRYMNMPAGYAFGGNVVDRARRASRSRAAGATAGTGDPGMYPGSNGGLFYNGLWYSVDPTSERKKKEGVWTDEKGVMRNSDGNVLSYDPRNPYALMSQSYDPTARGVAIRQAGAFGEAGYWDPNGNQALMNSVRGEALANARAQQQGAGLRAQLAGMDPGAAASYRLEAGLRGSSDVARALNNARTQSMLAQQNYANSVFGDLVSDSHRVYNSELQMKQQDLLNNNQNDRQKQGGVGGAIGGVIGQGLGAFAGGYGTQMGQNLAGGKQV